MEKSFASFVAFAAFVIGIYGIVLIGTAAFWPVTNFENVVTTISWFLMAGGGVGMLAASGRFGALLRALLFVSGSIVLFIGTQMPQTTQLGYGFALIAAAGLTGAFAYAIAPYTPRRRRTTL